MKRLLLSIITPLLILSALALPLVTTQPVYAQADPERAVCIGSGGSWSVKDGKGTCTSADNRTVLGTLRQVSNILIYIVGAISVIMIIVGGLKYVTSQGDQSGLTSAKNTILYALIGVAVAFMAFAMVNFVLINI